MSTKVIVLVLGFVTAAAAAGIAYHYSPELLNGDVDPRERVAAEAEAIPAPAVEPAAIPEDAEVAADSAPTVGADDAADLVAPSFDIIRVEPTGELLAAGRAAPGAAVDLLLGEEPLVSDESNIDGEWAVIPVAPLPVGEHELVLRATGPNGEGGPIEGDRATVIINGTGDSPVIAIGRPGERVQVIQRSEEVAATGDAPQPDEPEIAMHAAAAEEAAAVEGELAQAIEEELAQAIEEELAQGIAPAAPESQVGPEPSADLSGGAEGAGGPPPDIALADEPSQQGETIVEPVDEGRTVEQASDRLLIPEVQERQAVALAPPSEEAAIPAGRSAQDRGSGSEVVQRKPEPEAISAPHEGEEPTPEPVLRPAANDEETASPSSLDGPQDREGLAALPAPAETSESASGQAATPDVNIQTVEVTEVGEAQFTGRAEPGSTVRLYVNDQELDEAVAGTTGAWRAAGEIELPPGRYVARADVVDGEGEVRASARLRFDRVRIGMAEAGADDARPVEMPEAPDAEAVDRAGEAPAEAPRPAETDARMAAATDSAQIVQRVPSAQAEAAASRTDTAVDGHAADGASIETRVVIAPAAGASEPPVQALPEGAEAIHIERGDNLWRIARSIYGRGIQYERIYEANRNQIRNPHLIFPGQVFTIPLPDEESE